ncbi:MAG: alpha/beta hydrolase [Rhodobacteraceae bacterium]|nr:alpha/beta hydrolase [Paracoccaceae bacterium]
MLTLNERFVFKGQSVAWGSMGEGEPVVMIHGFPWNAQAWRNIAPWLAQSHKVFYFDMIGTGQSEKTAGQNVAASEQSDLLEALIGHWGLNAPQVIGHDFGGLAALRGHFLNGLKYSKLHLINAVAVLPSGSPFYAHVANHASAFAGMPDYAFEALFKAYVGNAAYYPLRQDAEDIYLQPWRGEEGKAAFFRQIAQADDRYIQQVVEQFKKADFDIHILWGVKDSFIPLVQGRELAERLRATSFTEISKAAHIVQEDAPEAIVGKLMLNL